MSSKLVKNTSIYTLGNILPQAASFILLPIYTRYMSPADYGIVNSMTVLQSILIILFTLGTERSIYRLYYDYKTDDEKKDFFGTLIIAMAFLSLSMTVIMLLMSDILGGIYKNIPFYPFYFYSIIISFLSSFANIPKVYFQVKEKAHIFIGISLTQFVLNNILIIYFVVFRNEAAYGMIKAYLFTAILLSPLFFFVSYKIMHFKFKFEIFKESLKFSLPMIPATLSAWTLNLSDRIFIERYFTLNDVGLYSLSSRIGNIILIFSQSFFKAYNPYFYKLANSENQEESKKQLYKTINIFVVIIFLFSFFIALFSKETIFIIFDKRYHDAYKIIPVLCLAYFFSQANGVLNLYFYQEKKTQLVMFFIILSAAINIIANFVLVPWYGAMGASISAFLSFFLLFIVQYSFSKKYYFIPFNWKLLMPLFAAAVVLFVGLNLEIYYNPYLILSVKVLVTLAASIVLLVKYKETFLSIFSKKTKNV